MFAKIGFIKPGIDSRLYSYAIPQTMQPHCHVGCRVKVNFAGKLLSGYILEITDECEITPSKLKEISKIEESDFVLSEVGIALSCWLVERYHCGWGAALKTMMPPGVNSVSNDAKTIAKQKLLGVEMAIASEKIEGLITATRSLGQKELLSYLLKNEGVAKVEELAHLRTDYLVHVNSLLKKGAIKKILDEYIRMPLIKEWSENNVEKSLNREQEFALDTIISDSENLRPFYLYGVTGSGKTEIYLRLIEACIKMGKQAVLLIPEIALTPQNIGRVYAKFKTGIAILHSGLSEGERIDQWRLIKQGKARIIIGARSAIFAPFVKLGLIIVDEEHESSYKQDNNPHYRVAEVAVKLKQLTGAKLLFASATPSYEALYKVEQGEYRFLALKYRFDGSMPPVAKVVDMRQELKEGNNGVFSLELIKEIANCLENRLQAIIFVGRRGYANFMLCRSCGHVIRCDDCDVSMTLHNSPSRLSCHYCGSARKVPNLCPACSSPFIRAFGVGTERVCDELAKIFIEARIIRMDYDTTRKKGDYDRILGSFAEGGADILVGTQMVIKGHDFPNVALAAVVNADTLLHFPDYRSGERSLQQLTQVAGRAGRGKTPGKVIVQTYFPQHVALQALLRNDYNYAYNQEIKKRKLLQYPPYTNIVRVLLSSLQEEKVGIFAREFSATIGKRIALLDNYRMVTLHGPAPSPISKLHRFYRWQFFVKAPAVNNLNDILDIIDISYTEMLSQQDNKNVSMVWELNPENIL
jgi:primosomal protein N' (replication factor Y)